MKTIGKLKLNLLSKAQLEKNELNRLKGGSNCCICGCTYSSTADNSNANLSGGSSGLCSSGGIGYGSYS